jgi:hypothetical protein
MTTSLSDTPGDVKKLRYEAIDYKCALYIIAWNLNPISMGFPKPEDWRMKKINS